MNYLRGQTRFTQLTHIHHAALPDGSVHPFEIKAAGAPAGAGKDVAVLKIEATNVPVLELGDSDAAQLLDHVTVAGYPAAADTFAMDILDRQSAFEASITDGKLSAKKAAADGAPILQISAPTADGSAGGPVLDDEGKILGVTAFSGDKVNGQEISGFGFAVPSSTIKEFVRQAGAVNELGAADRLYREGLELYWQGKYVSAMEKFEEVKRLYPRHSEVDRLIRGSQEAVANGAYEIDWFLTGVIAAVVLLVLGLAFLLLTTVIVFVVWRRRRSRRAARPAYAPEPDMTYAAYHVPPSGNTIRLTSPHV
jgi:hypothetical protein